MPATVFQCVAVVVAMIAQDVFATTLTIAEALNRARLAGVMDAANDYASRFGTVLTAGAAYTHGLWAWQTQLLLGLTALTSYNTTRRIVPFVHRRLDSDSRPRSDAEGCREHRATKNLLG